MNKSPTKNQLRKYFKHKRGEVIPSIRQQVFNQVKKELEHLINQDLIQGVIGIYWPILGEIDLRPLKHQVKSEFALPSSNSKGQIKYHPWRNTPLLMDSFKIPSPMQELPLKAESIGLILVPAIAIDSNGIRLGYGGGCFDRLRSQIEWKSIPSFVVLPKACVSSDPLPREEWDIPFDGWITEAGIHQAESNQKDN